MEIKGLFWFRDRDREKKAGPGQDAEVDSLKHLKKGGKKKEGAV